MAPTVRATQFLALVAALSALLGCTQADNILPSALVDLSNIPGSSNYTFACDYLVDNDLTCDDLIANITLVNTYIRTVADGVDRWVARLGYSPPLQITLQCSDAPSTAQCGGNSSDSYGDPRKRVRLYIAIQRPMTPRAVAAILGAAKALGVYSKYLSDLNQALGADSPWGAAAIDYQYGVQSACVVNPPPGTGLALGACAGPWDPATQVDPPAEVVYCPAGAAAAGNLSCSQNCTCPGDTSCSNFGTCEALCSGEGAGASCFDEADPCSCGGAPWETVCDSYGPLGASSGDGTCKPICANFTDDGDPANGPCGSGCLCSPAIQHGGLTLDTCNATKGLPGYGYCSHSGELYSECFPADALVQVEGSATTRMDQLQIGQRVLTLNKKGHLVFEEVMYFGHQIPHQDLTVVVLQIQTAASNTTSTLRVSQRHFVPTLCGSLHPGSLRYKHAETVEVGDRLVVVDGLLESSGIGEVVSVSLEVATGLYNPFTKGGLIVVDGVLASVHASWVLDPLTPAALRHHLPGIYQLLHAPWRLLYGLLGPVRMEWVNTVILAPLVAAIDAHLAAVVGLIVVVVGALVSWVGSVVVGLLGAIAKGVVPGPSLLEKAKLIGMPKCVAHQF